MLRPRSLPGACALHALLQPAELSRQDVEASRVDRPGRYETAQMQILADVRCWESPLQESSKVSGNSNQRAPHTTSKEAEPPGLRAQVGTAPPLSWQELGREGQEPQWAPRCRRASPNAASNELINSLKTLGQRCAPPNWGHHTKAITQTVEDVSEETGVTKHEQSTPHIKIYCKLLVIKALK